MRARFATVCALTALALGLAACGGATSTSPAPTPATQAPSAAQAANARAATLITVADIERLTGMTAVSTVARNASTGPFGDVNFASAGKPILMVTLGDRTVFESSKGTPNFGAVLTGLGDEAYSGPATSVNKTPYVVAALQGDHAVLLTTFVNNQTAGTTVLSIGQLEKLARIALSRWK
jgi:hypothetical protein